MPHVWWHVCMTIGDPTGAQIPVKVPEGQRGNLMGLIRYDHSLTDAEIAAKRQKLDALAMEIAEVLRMPQESIVFHAIQGQPTPAKDWKP